MARKKKKRVESRGQRADEKRRSVPSGLFTADQTPMMVFDGFSNPVARLGNFTDNIGEAAEYHMTRITRDMALLNSLYRNSWIVKRLIDVVPEDMMKNGYQISGQLDLESRRSLTRLERSTGLRAKVLKGMKWGRLYGGAAGIVIIDGHEDILDQPLDLDMVMPDSFKGLIILDRWSGIMPQMELEDDYSSPAFGLPKYYDIQGDVLDYGQRIHHSRVVRFTGRNLPYLEELGETYWGASELEHVFDELKKRDNTSFNIASLVFRANLLVYKKEGFEEMALMPAHMRQQLMQELTMLNAMLNNNGTQIIGAKDSLDTRQFTFSGLSDVYELFMMDVAGAAEIPVTKLFGRAPAGMNATGESDMQNYYDSIEEKQESDLRPVYDMLLPIMCMSAFGAVPDDLDYDFANVRRPSENERKSLAGQIGTAVTAAFSAGIISQKVALQELQNSTDLTGMWQSITDEDIEAADDGTMSGDVPDLFGNPLTAHGAYDRIGIRDSEKWITINGARIPVDENGELKGEVGERIVKSEYANSKRGSDVKTQSNNFGKGFEGDSGQDHLDKRHQEGNYTDMTLEQYESAALDLLNQEVGGDILGFDGRDGNVYRWNKQTGNYAVGEPNVRVLTMYPLRGGEERFNSLRAKKEKED